MDKPLMSGLVGQFKPKNSHIKREIIPSEKINTSQKGVFKLEPINFDVPIRGDKVMNANIQAHILSDEEMKKAGFEEYHFFWQLKESVAHLETMEEYMVVTIPKGPDSPSIYVMDGFTGEQYDYQQQLYDDEYNEYANRIHLNVQKVMKRLVEAGIITGYNKNDYI